MEMKPYQDKAVEIAVKHAKAMAKEEVEAVVLPAMEEYVKSTPTPVDDLFYQGLKDVIVKAVAGL